MKKLGIKPMGFHAWRRGAATAWVSQLGMPEKIAAYRLGHRCPGLTLGTYAQTFEGIDKGWELKIEKLLYGGGLE
jgi:integrase